MSACANHGAIFPSIFCPRTVPRIRVACRWISCTPTASGAARRLPASQHSTHADRSLLAWPHSKWSRSRPSASCTPPRMHLSRTSTACSPARRSAPIMPPCTRRAVSAGTTQSERSLSKHTRNPTARKIARARKERGGTQTCRHNEGHYSERERPRERPQTRDGQEQKRGTDTNSRN